MIKISDDGVGNSLPGARVILIIILRKGQRERESM